MTAESGDIARALSGLRCVGAIARHHDLDIRDQDLFTSYRTSDPADAETLALIASRVGLLSKAVKLPWEELSESGNTCPAILVLRDRSAVIWSGITVRDGVTLAVIRDLTSTQSFQFVNREQLEGNWSGEVVLIARRYALTDEDQPFGLPWFVPRLLKEKSSFRDIVLASLCLHIAALVIPMFFQLVVDRVLVHQAANTLFVLTFGVVVALIFESVFQYIRGLLVLHSTTKVDLSLSLKTYSHLLSLPIEFFERMTTGVLARHMQQTARIREFLTGRLLFTLLDASILIVLVPLLVFYSAALSLIVLSFSGLMALSIGILIPTYRRRLRHLYMQEGERQAFLVESVHGVNTIKAMGLEPDRQRQWEDRSAFAIQGQMEVGKIATIARTASSSLERAMVIAIVAVGAWLVFRGDLTVGQLVAFQMLSGRLSAPLVQIVSLINEFQDTRLSVEMLGEIMNRKPEAVGGTGVKPALQGSVQFENVTFQYDGTAQPALTQVSLKARPGSFIGVVGRSGSGKTTLGRLLQGLYRPSQGIVRIEDHDLREIDLGYLRSSMGVVLQDPFLFRGTIRENVALAKPGAAPEEIMTALRLAGAIEFIELLPRGVATQLEEGGANLSGGQRQRIALARALIRDPKILLLDEATSALDPESEAAIQESLGKLAGERTLIVISHRLNILANADNIVVLDQGRVIGEGRHPDLLESCEIYRSLWNTQVGQWQRG